jgi:hypothetical protein
MSKCRLETAQHQVDRGIRRKHDAVEIRPATVVRLRVERHEWDPATRESGEPRRVQAAWASRDQRHIHDSGVDGLMQLSGFEAMMSDHEA